MKGAWIYFACLPLLISVLSVSSCTTLSQRFSCSSCTTLPPRFSCWDGQKWINEGSYEYFSDNTLKECTNPAGNGVQFGVGTIEPDSLYTIRSCENDSPQECIDKEQIIEANRARVAISASTLQQQQNQSLQDEWLMEQQNLELERNGYSASPAQ